MRNGIILIDKPAGVTSAGVVARVKRALGASRVGHAGTLDPDATGLLVILVHGATRVASYAADGNKVYSGTIKLGVRTSTDDVAGEVLETCRDIPEFAAIQECARYFTGSIQQVPPKVSAIKVGGKRAHKLSRRGEEFELEARTVRIEDFSIWQDSADCIRYRVECSPGTYVRALARDLGERLGCGGAAASIRRERSGPLSVDQAIPLEQVGWHSLHDWSVLVPDLPRVELPEPLAESIHNGQRSSLRSLERLPLLTSLMRQPGLILYTAEGRVETMGILSVGADQKIDFEMNLGLKADSL